MQSPDWIGEVTGTIIKNFGEINKTHTEKLFVEHISVELVSSQ